MKEVSDPKERLSDAYRRCFGRLPSKDEREASRAFLEAVDDTPPRERWAHLFQALFASAEFRYVR